MSTGPKSKKSKKEQVDMMTLTDLEQVKVLADPLRIRIVEQLCDEEHTTKQVAEALGEKPTKLYHHVEALEKVGLIRQTRTRRNRGTLERYYLSVARRFKTEAALFAGQDAAPDTEAMHSVISTIIDTTSRELRELADLGLEDPTEEGLVSFVHLEADEETIARVRKRLQEVLADVQELDEPGEDNGDGPPRRKFRMTLAFYPLDRTGGTDS